MSDLIRDLRSALRVVRREPGLFLFAAVIVGLGIGASTAIFSVMRPLLLEPLPFEEPERLVWISNGSDPAEGMSAVTSRTSNVRDFRERARSFDGLTGYNAFFEQSRFNLTGDGTPQALSAVDVAQNFLEVLGVAPIVGRNFTVEEGAWGGPRALILSYAFWQSRFAGDPGIVGRSLAIDGEPHQVVGVLPEWFDFSSVFAPRTRVDYLRPWPISDETDRWGNTTSMIGRLRPGVTIEAAQAELDGILEALRREDEGRWGLAAHVSGLHDQIASPFRRGLWLLAGAAGAVLLIACVNLSNLLLAKLPRREREMAVRSALGAPRRRLMAQLLFESLVIAFLGAAVGLAIAAGITRTVASGAGVTIPMLQSVRIDATALLVGLGLALVTGVAVGIVPALRASRGKEAQVFSAAGRGTSSGRKTTRFREALVVSEVALALVLLVFGGLLLRSFENVLDVDLGYQPSQAVAWTFDSSREFDSYPEVVAFWEGLVAEVESIPGVEAVALTDALPLGQNRSWGLALPGDTDDERDQADAFPHIVDHRYFETMEIPLLSGRGFTRDDTFERPNLVVLNETAARTLFAGADPLGRTVLSAGREFEVIGVAGDVRHVSLEQGSGNEMYFSYAQLWGFDALEMVVRTKLPAETLAPGVAAAVARVDPSLPTGGYQTLDAAIDRSVSPRRFLLSILGGFAAVSLLLAALGIYGVLSYAVEEQRREIGIRMAMGESSRGVLGRVVASTLKLSLVGVLLGTVGAIALARFVESLLFGVASTDPGSFVWMTLVLLAVASLAGAVPALRASRTDPVRVLQAE